jgi:hypothetical protein
MVQVFESIGGMGFGEPVGNEEGEIEVAVVEAAFGDGGFVELVNADGDEFDFGSGMFGFEKVSFLV